MLYFHIPFCKQKCSYCNFHFSTSLAQKDEMLNAIHEEVKMRKGELPYTKIETIYFGGGTPSLLEADEICALIDDCTDQYEFSNSMEITLEANPDDLNLNYLKGLAKSPVNRLSIGTQSFYDKDLKFMNRAHNAMQAEDSIKMAQDCGFENLNIDLIYGVSDMNIWKSNLQKAVDLGVTHISPYALTVEPRTALAKWIKQGKVNAPSEDLQNDEFYYMSDFLKKNGFIHYEISNFAKKGFYSKHNSSYWTGKAYLGYGPSAHSFNGFDRRSWNIANNPKYIEGIFSRKRNFKEELLSEKDRLNELVMIGLRTIWGLNFKKIKKDFSSEILDEFQSGLKLKKEEGMIIEDNGFLKIPEKHWFLADGIASDLFLVNA